MSGRVVAVSGAQRCGSGHVVAPRLVLTSAHVVPEPGGNAEIAALGRAGTYTATVVWRGTPEGCDDAALPEQVSYLPSEDGEGHIKVGHGTFGPVTERMWEYDVGGTNVIGKWFSYRKSEPGGKKTSPLDDIGVEAWPREWVAELNELLTALRRVTDLEDAQTDLLAKILAGPIPTREFLTSKGVSFPQDAKSRKPRYDLSSTVATQQDGIF